VCCRYRIRAFKPALAHAGCTLEIVELPRGPFARVAWLVRAGRYDVVILQRKLLPFWMLKVLRRYARHLVFDFDDAILYRDSYDPRGPESPRRFRRFAATVRAADTIVAGNDYLADCALRAGARTERVRVIPTCVDTRRYSPSAGHDRAGGLDLVWIGASSTLQGLEKNRAHIDQLSRDVPGLRLRVICDRFPDLGSMPIIAIPWSETTEAAELAAADVGVSWVPDDLWSQGKCGLKVLQYQAAGLPVLANPVGVHEDMIRDGVTGWLPARYSDWVDALRALAGDLELRRRMGQAARASVEADYSVGAWESAFIATVTGTAPIPAPTPSVVKPKHATAARPSILSAAARGLHEARG
jgi:glycosyltransferase involved in cell wall biosynthesis